MLVYHSYSMNRNAKHSVFRVKMLQNRRFSGKFNVFVIYAGVKDLTNIMSGER